MAFITHGYDNLKSKHGVKVVHDTVVEIDPGNQSVKLAGGKTLKYDRLILSPGIDFTWDAIEGYDQPASEVMPHAWKAGEQTVNLRDKLQAMPDGGVVVIAPPGNPFRCPPGPYERASLIAHYLKANKPRSKILILDAKEKFSKQALFTRGWEKFYPGMIEWVSLTNGGEVKRVDTKTMTVYTEFDQHKVDVANIIPPQKAAGIAHRAGLTDQSGWCPVNQKTFESSLHAGIHVIGDSCIAGKMPKSGYSANSQAKVCAAAVVALLSGRETGEPSFINTCYSLVSPEYGISVAAVYKLENGSIVGIEGAGGVTPKDSESSQFSAEAVFAEGWYKNITYDMFG
jgi:sulfide dehydrogenase [flavocytochrome c] flavoprotein subunit